MQEVPPRKLFDLFALTVGCAVILSCFTGDMIWRNSLIRGIPGFPHPRPYYGLMPVPGTSVAPNSSGAMGADFSQVFLSAKAIRYGDSAYSPKNPEFKDRFGRRPNYPPLTNRLYLPLSYVSYDHALLIHNFGTLFLLLGLTALCLNKVGLREYILKTIGLELLLYFYTPLGFSHFERGQFDLIVASSLLLTYFSVFVTRNAPGYAVTAGFLGAIKWSSLPFLGTFCMMSFFGTSRRRRWVFVLIPGIVAFSAVVLLPELRDYWPSLQLYEFSATPRGVSFVYIMPRLLAKGFQILTALAILVLFLLLSHKGNRTDLFKSISFPFALSMAIQGMCYGTMSYEYRVVSLLGLVPGLLVWLDSTVTVPTNLKIIVSGFFALYVVTAFRVFHFLIWTEANWRPVGMSIVYLITSLFGLIICAYMIIKAKSSPQQLERPVGN